MSSLYDPPSKKTVTFYHHQQRRDRRVNFTIWTLQHITLWFGNFGNFVRAIFELRKVLIKNPDNFSFQFPPELEDLFTSKESVLKELKEDARNFSPVLQKLGKFSKEQWTLLKSKIKYLPCYRTTVTDWESQIDITDMGDIDFFYYLENGIRAICETRPPKLLIPHISMYNMFRWILYLIVDLMVEYFPCDEEILVDTVFALWADGGKVYGGIEGLFSALKVVKIDFTKKDKTPIIIPYEQLKWLVSTCWTMSIDCEGETIDSISKLEEQQIAEYKELMGTTITYKFLTMSPKLVGWCTDHGYRLKGIGKDDKYCICGECSFSKKPLYDDNNYEFLNFLYLMGIKEVTPENWGIIRKKDMPKALSFLIELQLSLLSYDNHHNMVGLFKKLFSVLIYSLSSAKLEIVWERMKTLTGIENKNKKKKEKKNVRRIFPYQGWQWRLASLSFKDVFEGIFYPEKEKELFILFELLNEIHLVNYTHFDRTAENFNYVILRYWMILCAYTKQLKKIFTNEEAIFLNDTYTHKVLVHSPRIFMIYNLALFSCEQGEGNISVTNRLLRANGVSGNKSKSIKKALEYLLLRQEYKGIKNERDPSSRVWSDNNICIKDLLIVNDSDTQALLNFLRSKTFDYLKGYDCPKYWLVKNKHYAKVSSIVTYSNQINRLPPDVKLESEEKLQIKNNTLTPPSLDIPIQQQPDKIQIVIGVLTRHKQRYDKAINDINTLKAKLSEKLLIRWLNIAKELKTIQNKYTIPKKKENELSFIKGTDICTFVADYVYEINYYYSQNDSISGSRNEQNEYSIYRSMYLLYCEMKDTFDQIINIENETFEFLNSIPFSLALENINSVEEIQGNILDLSNEIRQFAILLKAIEIDTTELIDNIQDEAFKPNKYQRFMDAKLSEIRRTHPDYNLQTVEDIISENPLINEIYVEKSSGSLKRMRNLSFATNQVAGEKKRKKKRRRKTKPKTNN